MTCVWRTRVVTWLGEKDTPTSRCCLLEGTRACDDTLTFIDGLSRDARVIVVDEADEPPAKTAHIDALRARCNSSATRTLIVFRHLDSYEGGIGVALFRSACTDIAAGTLNARALGVVDVARDERAHTFAKALLLTRIPVVVIRDLASAAEENSEDDEWPLLRRENVTDEPSIASSSTDELVRATVDAIARASTRTQSVQPPPRKHSIVQTRRSAGAALCRRREWISRGVCSGGGAPDPLTCPRAFVGPTFSADDMHELAVEWARVCSYVRVDAATQLSAVAMADDTERRALYLVVSRGMRTRASAVPLLSARLKRALSTNKFAAPMPWSARPPKRLKMPASALARSTSRPRSLASSSSSTITTNHFPLRIDY